MREYFQKIFKKLYKLYKENRTVLNILGFLTLAIALVYWFPNSNAKVILEDISIILAIPSIVLSLAVIKVLNVDKGNIEIYINRMNAENTIYKKNKSKAKKALDDMLSEMETLGPKYLLYLNNNGNNAPSNIKICKEGAIKLNSFYRETFYYIFYSYLPTVSSEGLGDLEKLSKGEGNSSLPVNFISLQEKEEIKAKLGELCHKMAWENKLKDLEKELIKCLFDEESGLMKKYLDTCLCAYDKLKTEDEEIGSGKGHEV